MQALRKVCSQGAWEMPGRSPPASYLLCVLKGRLPKEVLTWLFAIKKIISKIKPRVVFYLNGQALVPISLNQDPKKIPSDSVGSLPSTHV